MAKVSDAATQQDADTTQRATEKTADAAGRAADRTTDAARAATYAEACRAVMAALAEGRIAPADAPPLLRACKMSFEAARVFERTRR